MKPRTLLLTIILSIMCINSYAQYDQYNSVMRKAIVMYKCGADGFYYSTKDVMLERVDNVVNIYAYDKKTQNLYLLTPYSNCEVTVTKDAAKVFKKSKSVLQIKGDELVSVIEEHNRQLDEKFSQLNQKRQKHLEDSIAQARAKARADSIERARRDSIQRVREAEARESYRATKMWRKVPCGNHNLKCKICDKIIQNEDTLYCFGINNDSIMFWTIKEGDLDLSYVDVHVAEIDNYLQSYEPFKYHCEVFKDSLNKVEVSSSTAETLAAFSYLNYLDEVRKEAPFGYIEDWGWDDEYSMITFHFTYTNTNKKTIKYIAVHFKVTNDVGDVRKTGYFQGTGPVEEFHTCSWNWDSSPYFVSGDASTMEFTKIVITYMNGTQKVLGKNQIVYN